MFGNSQLMEEVATGDGEWEYPVALLAWSLILYQLSHLAIQFFHL